MTKLEKYQALTDSVREFFDSESDKIQSKDHWTPQARQEAQAALIESHRTQMAQLKEQYQAEISSEINRLEISLFNPSRATDSESDKVIKMQSYRSAISQVEAALAPIDSIDAMKVELARLGDQSTQTGDDILKRAVAFSALKYNFFDQAMSLFSAQDQAKLDQYLDLVSIINDPVSKSNLQTQMMFAASA